MRFIDLTSNYLIESFITLDNHSKLVDTIERKKWDYWWKDSSYFENLFALHFRKSRDKKLINITR